MDKKDIYEHLAKIYLDASSKRKKKKKIYHHLTRNWALTGIVLASILSAGFIFAAVKSKRNSAETGVSLVLLHNAAKLNFHFEPAKKETFFFEFKNLNLSTYKTLAFSVRKMQTKEDTALRVEFVNVFKEKSEVYVRNIPEKWQDFKINISDFKGISDWSEMSGLWFTVEEWNTQDKRGIVYLDNVRLLK